jgi:transcriptional regulator with XRE-family HTH domain
MDDGRIGRAIRALRHRRGWRQVDLAQRAGISQSAVSDIERGRIDRYTLRHIRRLLVELDAACDVTVLWGGRGQLDRLLDQDHARLTEAWASLHARLGWQVWAEASFSVYGERGRIDLLAYHARTGTLEVVECKTIVADIQDLLGRLDAKVRLAPTIAAGRGWRVRRVVPSLVIADGRTAHRRTAEHRQLFSRFDLRGRAARAFVRDPRRQGSGLLAFVPLPRTNHGGLGRAGQQRVRVSTPSASVAGRPERTRATISAT